MNMVFRTFCVVSLMIGGPSVAIAETNTAFDGTYAGVSNSAAGGGSDCHPFEPIPRPLTLRNGDVHFTGGSFATGDVVFEGTVSPQGDFKMWDMFMHNLIGKIDPSGKATGSIDITDNGCVLTGVWQRQ